MRLLHKLLILLFCAVMIPIGLAAFFLSSYRAQARNSVMTLQKNVVQLSALMAEREMQDLSRRFDRMEIPDSGHISREDLFSIIGKNPEFLFFALADRQGNALQSGGDPEFVRLFGNASPEGDSLFLEARRTGRPAAGDFENMFNIPACRIVYPFGSDRYIFAIVSLRDLADKLEQQKLASGGLLLADNDGNSILFAQALEKFSKDTIKAMTEAEGLMRVYGENGSRLYIVFSEPVRGTNLRLIAVREEAEAFASLNRMSWLMAFLALAVATALYFSALFFARKAGQPLEALVSASKRIAIEDFKTPISVHSEFKELSDLIDSFNVMMKELQRYHGIHLEKIFEEKHKLELLISLISDGIIFCGLDGSLMYANDAAMKILNGGDKELPPEERQKKILSLFQKTSSEEKIINVSYEDEEKCYAVNARPVYAKTEAQSVFITLHDITLERELRRIKEDFFSSAAHDLRAPLLSMQGYVKLLEYAVKEKKEKEYVANLNDSSKRLFTLIENILDFSRLDSGSFSANPQKICLDDFFNEAARLFEPVFSEHGISFSYENRMPPGHIFEADPDLLRRVTDNLLSNAVKFTPEGGSVSFIAEEASADLVRMAEAEISGNIAERPAERKDIRLLFTVKDSGPGIPENKLKEIFEKYRQLGNRRGKGFGLGLAICKKIVELHGGFIWADSGKGAAFHFII